MKVVVILFHFALIFGLAYALAKRWGETKSKFYGLVFIYHLTAGLSVGLVYQYYYSANDTWEYFNTAAKLADFAREDFSSYVKLLFDFGWDQGPYIPTNDFRSVIFIKMISGFCLIADNNYWICAAYFSLLSFGASWFLFRKITFYFKEAKPAAAVAFLLFPSVVFWSSGIEKETLSLASLYYLAAIFLQIFYDRKASKLVLVLAIIASAILWALKYYWAGVFFISAIAAFAVQLLFVRWLWVRNNLVAVYISLFVFIGGAMSFAHPNFYPHRFLEVLVANHDAFVNLSKEQGLIHYYELSATVKSIIINSPWALFSGIFRPIIGEGQGLLGLLASLENLIILVLFVSLMWKFKKQKQPLSILAMAVISYCIVLCIFLALSTPNLGTLSRYRVGFLPFLVFALAYRNPLFDFVTRKFLS